MEKTRKILYNAFSCNLSFYNAYFAMLWYQWQRQKLYNRQNWKHHDKCERKSTQILRAAAAADSALERKRSGEVWVEIKMPLKSFEWSVSSFSGKTEWMQTIRQTLTLTIMNSQSQFFLCRLFCVISWNVDDVYLFVGRSLASPSYHSQPYIRM